MSRDRVTYCGIFAVAIAAAVLSFSSLTGLAVMAGITGAWAGFRLAWLLPIAVDAYAVTATRVWLTRDAAEHTVRYARANAIGAIGLSVAGNATFHGLRAAGVGSLGHASAGWVLVVAVSAVPPVMLGLVGHLHALVAVTATDRVDASAVTAPKGTSRQPVCGGSDERQRSSHPASVATEPTTHSPNNANQSQKAREVTDRATSRTGRSRATGKASTGSGPSGAEAAMREHWRTERAQGRTPSGAELDRVAGTRDYGRRIRRTLLAEDEAAGPSSSEGHATSAAEEPARPTSSAARPATEANDGSETPGLEPQSLSRTASRDAA